MAGCYGDHDFDRHFERQLNEYLTEDEIYCNDCEWTGDEDDLLTNDGDVYYCPICESTDIS